MVAAKSAVAGYWAIVILSAAKDLAWKCVATEILRCAQDDDLPARERLHLAQVSFGGFAGFAFQ